MASRSAKMQVRVEKDEYGLPVVSWVDPQREYKSALLVFRWTSFPNYAARCWIGIDDSTAEPLFSFRHDKYNDRVAIETPLSNVVGFSLHTLSELFDKGTTPKPSQGKDVENYRDHLVLVADLKKACINGLPPFLPLTSTIASRIEVMELHAALTEAFLVNIDALKPALAARQKKWKQEQRNQKWNALLKPPIISGGRKFVNVWKREQSSDGGSIIYPANGECSFGSYFEKQEGSARAILFKHIFERKRHGVAERWMANGAFWICGASDTHYPELVRFSRANTEEITGGYKPRKLFQAVRLFNGGELQLPPAYLAAPDARIDASTLILCLEFSDGELMPLTHAPVSEKAGVEKLRGQLEYFFSGEGEGASKIVL